MSELRAPDPILDAHAKRMVLVEDVKPPVAHLMSTDEGCGRVSDIDWNERASEARWFAVPCRECFPDAPPPGCRERNGHVGDPGLAWQVQP